MQPQTALPRPADETKAERYARLAGEIASVLEGEADEMARMATVSAMLAAEFPHFFWTGFYRLDPARGGLVVGPYQGTLGCLRIAIGQGVCGAAAQSGETVIVPDVEAFPGHIACDTRSRSEIVVPVLGAGGALIAVLDVDCQAPDAFDGVDAAGLERIVRRTFAA